MVLKENSDYEVKITFSNTYNIIPMVIPIIYSENNYWCYSTSMVSQITKTSCIINIHNLENIQVTINVGYIAFG